MVKKVRISVAMVSYNGGRHIREQIASILPQLGEEDELVVSDDGSTDQTIGIIREYQGQDARVRLVEGPRKGIKKNVEHALRHTNGDYIFLADQDDIWMPDKVKQVMEAFRQQKAMVVIHDASVFEEKPSKEISSGCGMQPHHAVDGRDGITGVENDVEAAHGSLAEPDNGMPESCRGLGGVGNSVPKGYSNHGGVGSSVPEGCSSHGGKDYSAGSVKRNIIIESFFQYRGSRAGVFKNMMKNSYIGCCMAFRRELLLTALPIPGRIEMHDQWIGVLGDYVAGKSCFLQKKLLLYRRHGENNSSMKHYGIGKMLRNRIVFFGYFFVRILQFQQKRQRFFGNFKKNNG